MARSDLWDQFPVGTRVRCRDPDDYLSDVARKLRNREGVVRSLQPFSGTPIVDFPAVGRRKAFTWVPSNPRDVMRVDEAEDTTPSSKPRPS